MGIITESFANVTELLLSEREKGIAAHHVGTDRNVFLTHLLKPLMPAALRCGTGIVSDLKDRQVGPMDVVGCWEIFPAFGDVQSATFLAEGVAFCLQIRNWSVDDLTSFGETAAKLKKLERKRKGPIPCFAVSYDLLLLDQVAEFLKSPGGQAVDGVLSLGHNVMIRNREGLYGNPSQVPFVTERSGPDALKAFSFLLMELAQNFIGLPFGLSDYQHL